MMRWLLVEAAQTAARLDPQLRRIYQRLKKRTKLSLKRQDFAPWRSVA
jgi:type IV secretory pathway TrbD component